MDYEFVIKCSKCRHLLPLDMYDNKFNVCNEDKPQVIIKKKCCKSCLIESRIHMKAYLDNHRYDQ